MQSLSKSTSCRVTFTLAQDCIAVQMIPIPGGFHDDTSLGDLASVTPIMLSLVTSSLRRSSLQPSVPLGRMGTTMYLRNSSIACDNLFRAVYGSLYVQTLCIQTPACKGSHVVTQCWHLQ